MNLTNALDIYDDLVTSGNNPEQARAYLRTLDKTVSGLSTKENVKNTFKILNMKINFILWVLAAGVPTLTVALFKIMLKLG